MRPRALALSAAVAAAALVLLIPFERFIETSALSDTLMLLPWWSVQDHVSLEWVAELAFGLAVALGAAFLLIPRRYAIALPLVVLAYYAAVFHPIWAGSHGVKQASAGAVFQGIRGVSRDWIDAALPADARAAVLWTGRADRFTVNQNEFFNRTVGPVYYLRQPTPGGVGETQVRIDPRNGLVRLPDGDPLAVEYLLTDGSVTPDGEVVARDDLLGTTLWRVDGDVVSTTSIRGLYPNDSWSGEAVTWRRRLCRGGELVVSLSSDPSLFESPQRVRSWAGSGLHAYSSSPTRKRSSACRSNPARTRASSRSGWTRRRFPLRCSRGRGPPGARRALQRLRLQTGVVRIAFDVSPLSHPPLGIGNYIRGSLGGLVEAAGAEHEVVAFAPRARRARPDSSRARRNRRRASHLAHAVLPCASNCVERRRAACRRAASRRVRRAPLLGLDVPAATCWSQGDDDPRPRPAPSSRMDDFTDALDARAQVPEHRADV